MAEPLSYSPELTPFATKDQPIALHARVLLWKLDTTAAGKIDVNITPEDLTDKPTTGEIEKPLQKFAKAMAVGVAQTCHEEFKTKPDYSANVTTWVQNTTKNLNEHSQVTSIKKMRISGINFDSFTTDECAKMYDRYFGAPATGNTVNIVKLGDKQFYVAPNVQQFIDDAYASFKDQLDNADAQTTIRYLADMFGKDNVELIMAGIRAKEIAESDETKRKEFADKANEEQGGNNRRNLFNKSEETELGRLKKYEDDATTKYVLNIAKTSVTITPRPTNILALGATATATPASADTAARTQQQDPIPADEIGKEFKPSQEYSLEGMFGRVPGEVPPNHEYTVEGDPQPIVITATDHPRFTKNRNKAFFVDFSTVTPPYQFKTNKDVIPYVFDPTVSDNDRFKAAEDSTHKDSGLFALCAVSAKTPTEQAKLYEIVTQAITALHQQNGDIIANWLLAQHNEPGIEINGQKINSLHQFIVNDYDFSEPNKPKLRPENERLLTYNPDGSLRLNTPEEMTDYVHLWERRITEIQTALHNHAVQPYHLRWIEFLSHSVDVDAMMKEIILKAKPETIHIDISATTPVEPGPDATQNALALSQFTTRLRSGEFKPATTVSGEIDRTRVVNDFGFVINRPPENAWFMVDSSLDAMEKEYQMPMAIYLGGTKTALGIHAQLIVNGPYRDQPSNVNEPWKILVYNPQEKGMETITLESTDTPLDDPRIRRNNLWVNEYRVNKSSLDFRKDPDLQKIMVQLETAKLARFQYDAQNCVPYCCFIGAMLNALKAGDTDFKTKGIPEFAKHYKIALKTREQFVAEVAARKAAPPAPALEPAEPSSPVAPPIATARTGVAAPPAIPTIEADTGLSTPESEPVRQVYELFRKRIWAAFSESTHPQHNQMRTALSSIFPPQVEGVQRSIKQEELTNEKIDELLKSFVSFKESKLQDPQPISNAPLEVKIVPSSDKNEPVHIKYIWKGEMKSNATFSNDPVATYLITPNTEIPFILDTSDVKSDWTYFSYNIPTSLPPIIGHKISCFKVQLPWVRCSVMLVGGNNEIQNCVEADQVNFSFTPEGSTPIKRVVKTDTIQLGKCNIGEIYEVHNIYKFGSPTDTRGIVDHLHRYNRLELNDRTQLLLMKLPDDKSRWDLSDQSMVVYPRETIDLVGLKGKLLEGSKLIQVEDLVAVDDQLHHYRVINGSAQKNLSVIPVFKYHEDGTQEQAYALVELTTTAAAGQTHTPDNTYLKLIQAWTETEQPTQVEVPDDDGTVWGIIKLATPPQPPAPTPPAPSTALSPTAPPTDALAAAETKAPSKTITGIDDIKQTVAEAVKTGQLTERQITTDGLVDLITNAWPVFIPQLKEIAAKKIEEHADQLDGEVIAESQYDPKEILHQAAVNIAEYYAKQCQFNLELIGLAETNRLDRGFKIIREVMRLKAKDREPTPKQLIKFFNNPKNFAALIRRSLFVYVAAGNRYKSKDIKKVDLQMSGNQQPHITIEIPDKPTPGHILLQETFGEMVLDQFHITTHGGIVRIAGQMNIGILETDNNVTVAGTNHVKHLVTKNKFTLTDRALVDRRTESFATPKELESAAKKEKAVAWVIRQLPLSLTKGNPLRITNESGNVVINNEVLVYGVEVLGQKVGLSIQCQPKDGNDYSIASASATPPQINVLGQHVDLQKLIDENVGKFTLSQLLTMGIQALQPDAKVERAEIATNQQGDCFVVRIKAKKKTSG